jgi:hypothetical protein
MNSILHGNHHLHDTAYLVKYLVILTPPDSARETGILGMTYLERIILILVELPWRAGSLRWKSVEKEKEYFNRDNGSDC